MLGNLFDPLLIAKELWESSWTYNMVIFPKMTNGFEFLITFVKSSIWMDSQIISDFLLFFLKVYFTFFKSHYEIPWNMTSRLEAIAHNFSTKYNTFIWPIAFHENSHERSSWDPDSPNFGPIIFSTVLGLTGSNMMFTEIFSNLWSCKTI